MPLCLNILNDFNFKEAIKSYSFLIFGSLLIFASLFVFFFVPETKNKSTEKIVEMFDRGFVFTFAKQEDVSVSF